MNNNINIEQIIKNINEYVDNSKEISIFDKIEYLKTIYFDFYNKYPIFLSAIVEREIDPIIINKLSEIMINNEKNEINNNNLLLKRDIIEKDKDLKLTNLLNILK